jgi:hypothetical protein
MPAKRMQVSVSVLSTAGFGSPLARDERDFLCQAGQKSDHRSKTAGNLANVGLKTL